MCALVLTVERHGVYTKTLSMNLDHRARTSKDKLAQSLQDFAHAIRLQVSSDDLVMMNVQLCLGLPIA